MKNQKQKDFLLQTEADNWFERNLNSSDKDFSRIEPFTKYVSKKSKVLEVGCSGGWNSQVFETKGAQFTGIDPSQKAIQYAQKQYPQSEFLVGYSDQLDFPDESFDAIFLGFCLYLTDRKLLSKTVAEVDRVLKNKGYLFILDFDTKFPLRVPYRDQDDMFTYKMDYSKLWLAYPEYYLVEKQPSCHKKVSFNLNVQERLSSSILYKDSDSAYKSL